MKTCTKCKESKEDFCFRKQKTGRNGLHASCKACESAYGKSLREGPRADEIREYNRVKMAEFRKTKPENVRKAKRKYYASTRGKECKKREEAAYRASGGRAKAEAKRAASPLSEARVQSRLRYHNRKRSAERELSEFDSFVLAEAVTLMRERNEINCCFTKWHVDHVKPVSKGGLSTHDNLQVVPAKWNQSKSHRHENRFFIK